MNGTTSQAPAATRLWGMLRSSKEGADTGFVAELLSVLEYSAHVENRSLEDLSASDFAMIETRLALELPAGPVQAFDLCDVILCQLHSAGNGHGHTVCGERAAHNLIATAIGGG